MNPTQSYRKVQYELRAAKQVERRMLIDALQTLGAAGFAIPEYQYTGFGSIYFVDFVLFHKYLGISRMWSVEHDTAITKRIRFNRPFNFVKIFMADAGEVIAKLSTSRNHLLWLDYDSFISSTVAEHMYLALSRLRPGSIVLVTVDVEPPLKEATPEDLKKYFIGEVERYLPPKPKFSLSGLPQLNLGVLERICNSAVSVRDGVSFQPLFSFLYRDGHQMLTVGGMLVDEAKRGLLENPALRQKTYMKFSWKDAPFNIVVPRLTRKERITLEGSMPATDGWAPRNFELTAADVEAYREIYRYYPVYAELVL
jgi:hypothetical protein